MVALWRKLLVAGLLWICAAPASAAVSAELSTQDIDELETVQLRIRATDTRQTETLDLTTLEQDFHVMGSNTSSQYRYINGREQSWVDYQITLQPKVTGLLTIPSVRIGAEQTPTLTLNVRPLTDQTRKVIDDLVFFEQDLSDNAVYVQAQVVLTRRLLYSNGVQLYSDLPGAPEIKDAVVLSLGETSSGTTERRGKVYGMVQQQYAIFPEASGTLDIPAISVTASVRLVDAGRVSRKGVRVGTQPAQIEVKPVPATYPNDQPWLPAQHVSLQRRIAPADNAEVGDTLSLISLLGIDGNIGSMAPPLDLPLDPNQLRAYPQNPEISDDTNTEIVVGSRIQTTSIVPLRPGELVVPAQQVFWWDTLADEMRIAHAPPLHLQVSGTAIAMNPAESPAVDGTLEQETTPVVGTAPDPIAVWTTQVTRWGRQHGLWLACALLCVTVAALAWHLRSKLNVRLPRLHRLRQRQHRHELLKQVEAAPPGELLNSLAEYLVMYFERPRRDALAAFAASGHSARQALNDLHACAYGPGGKAFDQQQRAALSAALTDLSAATAPGVDNPLPPLYPDSTPAGHSH